MLFTREGWTMAIAATVLGFLCFTWAGWPWALVGAPVGFMAFMTFAYFLG